jgi:outer membrane protein assembly factor BamB
LGGIDEDGSMTGTKGAEAFRRTMSTVSIFDGLVYAPDLSGRIHCIDFETGKRYWEADVLAAIWGSTMVVDGKVFLGDEDGILSVFEAGKKLNKIKEIEFRSSIYSTPTIANGVMFVSDRSRLYAFDVQ